MLAHFTFLKSIAHATPKMTIPSPSVLHFRQGPGTRLTRRPRPRRHARWPEVCPPIVSGPTRGGHVPLITRGFLLTTTVRGWTGPPHAPLCRLLTIQYT